MKKGQKTLLRLVIIAAVIAAVAGGAYIGLTQRSDIKRSIERASLPEAVERSQISPSPILPTSQPTTNAVPVNPTTSPVTNTLPAEVNLAIPFTPQAPHGNWDDPYGEFCEEASLLMAARFMEGQGIPNPDVADQDLFAIHDFEMSRFGYYKDTTIAETAIILREHFSQTNFEIVENPTVNDIKQAVASGKPVIVPAAGRQLGNPYFSGAGPLYHMYVIKGYTKNGQFIVNDPGTRRGADFLYSESVVMSSMHDWRPDRQIELGRKAILIVG